MPESLRHLDETLRAKQHELESVNNVLTGAGIGALLTRGSAIGIATGAVLIRDKNKKEQLEREIANITNKIQETHAYISQLKTKQSDLMNQYQNNKARFEADTHQKYTELERQKIDGSNPEVARTIDDQLSRLRSDSRAQEAAQERDHQRELDSIQQEINQLSL